MNGKRSFYIMLGVTSLLVIALGGATVASYTLLKKQADKLQNARLESALLDEQQGSLIKANKDIAKYTDLEKIANTVVPQDKDQARTVREIVALADASKVPIASISFPSSTLGQIVPKSTGSTSNSSSPVIAAPLSQVKKVDGLSGVYQMEINVQSNTTQPVPYNALIDFLQRLENSRRTAQVSNITITPDNKDISKVTFSLGINVYIKP